jgi:ribosomal protein S12 methylthiotransferase accessory factor
VSVRDRVDQLERSIGHRRALADTRKRFTRGTHRVLDPRELLARVQPLLKCAGVTRLANITGLDRIGVPTVTAVRPAALTLCVAAGKGTTLEAATVSAAMEAIEVFHAEVAQPDEIHCAYADLVEMESVADPYELPLIRDAIFHPRLTESWTLAADLLAGGQVAVPTQLVTLALPRATTRSFFRSSNGLASGAVGVEALLAALLEVVERDAVACCREAARVAGRSLPRVDLNSLQRWPLVADVLHLLADARVRPIVYDCTVDTNIPVYMARLWDERQPAMGVYLGSGAHLDPEIAVLRALTEAAQSRAVYIAGARDDLSGRAYVQFRAHAADRLVAALESQPATIEATSESAAADTFEADVQSICERLETIGVRHVAMVELTLPEFKHALSVVRVVVPGLATPAVERGHPSRRTVAFAEKLAA